MPDTGPLARPRGFRLTPDDLLDAPGPIHVRGPDGKDLPGSPLDPSADSAAHVAAALRIGTSYPAAGRPAARRCSRPSGALRRHRESGTPRRCARAGPTSAPIVAARGDGRHPRPQRRCGRAGLPGQRACFDTGSARILVVDDGSSDPALIAALDDLARQRKITLLRHPAPLGFPASANAGIRAAKGRDVVLLNSDTLVPPGWLQRLRDAAYSAPRHRHRHAAVERCQHPQLPRRGRHQPKPDQAATNRLDRLAARANGAAVVDIPVGVGFCLYLRRDCLNAVGIVPRRPVRPGLRRGERSVPARPSTGLAQCRADRAVRRPLGRRHLRRQRQCICASATAGSSSSFTPAIRR